MPLFRMILDLKGGLAVVDEQHKFGVMQRGAIKRRATILIYLL